MHAGEVVADRFELQRLAGSGGAGEVWRKHDRVVALKILSGASSAAGRFEREAQTLSELRHPGVVRYLAHGLSSDGSRYLAMEWLDGEDLSARLKRGGLSLADAVAVVARV